MFLKKSVCTYGLYGKATLKFGGIGDEVDGFGVWDMVLMMRVIIIMTIRRYGTGDVDVVTVVDAVVWNW